MPVPYTNEDPRDEIAKAVAAAPTPLGKAMSAIPPNPMQQFNAASMGPPTPAGGVPGSGLAPAGGSIVATPPAKMGMQGAMRPMAGTAAAAAPPLGGLGAPMAMPTGMPGGGPTPEGVDQYGLMPQAGGMRRGRIY